MNEPRVGRVVMSAAVASEAKALLDAIGFRVIRSAAPCPGSDCVEALVECPKFRPVAPGECVPEYKVTINSRRDPTQRTLPELHSVTTEEQPWVRTDACVACTRKPTVTIDAGDVASPGLLAELFADIQRIDETSILPDGDWVSVCVATWAAEWVKRLKDAGLITANTKQTDGDQRRFRAKRAVLCDKNRGEHATRAGPK